MREYINAIHRASTLSQLIDTLTQIRDEYSNQKNQSAVTPTNLDDWLEIIQLSLNHPFLNDDQKRFSENDRAKCFSYTLHILSSVIEQLHYQTASQWQNNESLKNQLFVLGKRFASKLNPTGLGYFLKTMKYMDTLNDVTFQTEIKPTILDNLNTYAKSGFNEFSNDPGLFNGMSSCLLELAFYYSEQDPATDNYATNILKRFLAITYEYIKTSDSASISMKRSFVQAFHALHHHHQDLTKHIDTDKLQEFEQALLISDKGQASPVENIILQELENAINAPIKRQTLFCGYPVDGVIKLGNKTFVIEIDGTDHDRLKKYLSDLRRDALIAQGATIIRIDQFKMRNQHYNAAEKTSNNTLDNNLHNNAKLLSSYIVSNSITLDYSQLNFVKTVHIQQLQPEAAKQFLNANTLSLQQSSSPASPTTLTDSTQWLDSQGQLLLSQLPDDYWTLYPQQTLELLAFYEHDINSKDTEGNSVLDYIIHHDAGDSFKTFYEHGLAITSSKALKTAGAQLHPVIQDSLDKQLADTIAESCTAQLESLLKAGARTHKNKHILNQPDIVHWALTYASDTKPLHKILDKMETHPKLVDSQNGQNLLHKAIEYGKSDEHTIKRLLQLANNKIDRFDKPDNQGYTPLHYAITRNDPELIENLNTHGFTFQSVKKPNPCKNLCQLAETYNCPETKQYLLQKFAYELVAHAEASSQDLVQYFTQLAKLGAWADLPYYPINHGCYQNRESSSALGWALYYNHLALAEHLQTNHGASLTFANEQGLTPIHYAATNPDITMNQWKKLFDKLSIAPFIQTTQQGDSALHLAVNSNNWNLTILLVAKASPKDWLKTNKPGYTPLWLMLTNPDTPKNIFKSIVSKLQHEQLLASFLETPDAQGLYPIHIAAQTGQTELFNTLVANYNADPHQLTDNAQKLKPLHVAMLAKQTTQVDQILQNELNQATFDTNDGHGRSLLTFITKQRLSHFLNRAKDYDINKLKIAENLVDDAISEHLTLNVLQERTHKQLQIASEDRQRTMTLCYNIINSILVNNQTALDYFLSLQTKPHNDKQCEIIEALQNTSFNRGLDRGLMSSKILKEIHKKTQNSSQRLPETSYLVMTPLLFCAIENYKIDMTRYLLEAINQTANDDPDHFNFEQSVVNIFREKLIDSCIDDSFGFSPLDMTRALIILNELLQFTADVLHNHDSNAAINADYKQLLQKTYQKAQTIDNSIIESILAKIQTLDTCGEVKAVLQQYQSELEDALHDLQNNPDLIKNEASQARNNTTTSPRARGASGHTASSPPKEPLENNCSERTQSQTTQPSQQGFFQAVQNAAEGIKPNLEDTEQEPNTILNSRNS